MIFDGDVRGRGVRNHLRSPSSGGETLLLGFKQHRGARVLVAFEAGRHTDYPYSKSLQVKEQTLDAALGEPLATHQRKSGEVIFAFREEYFATYLRLVRRPPGGP